MQSKVHNGNLGKNCPADIARPSKTYMFVVLAKDSNE